MQKLFIFLFSFICFFGKSQTSSTIFKSNKNFLKWGDYYSINGEEEKAIKYYSKNESNLSPDQRRAFSISLQNRGYLKRAAKALEPLLETKEVSIIDYYNYASLIPQNKKLSDEYIEKASKLTFDSNLQTDQKNIETSYKLKNLSINSEKSEFGAVLLNLDKPTFYYLGDQKQRVKRLTTPYQVYNIYKGILNLDSLELKTVTEFDLRFNSKYQDGPLSIDYLSNTFFLTRSSNKLDKNNKVQLDLFQLSFEEIEKKIPSQLSINIQGYSTLHPSVSPDGKRLYFASDRPGGFGGMDLYYVPLEKGVVAGELTNLGSDINTSEDEVFPFLYENNILFYSSRTTEKRLSIMLAINRIENRWETKPLKQPFNLDGDNFSFSIAKKDKIGFLTSNRKGGKGDDDIYAFDFIANLKGEKDNYNFKRKDTLVVGFNSVLKNDLSVMLTEDPLIEIIPLEAKLIQETLKGDLNFNSNGSFWYVPDPDEKGKDSFTYQIIGPDSNSENIKVELIPDKTDFNGVFRPIYYKYDKYNLETDYKSRLDSLVIQLNQYPDLNLEISSFADCRGASDYNLKLTVERNQTILNYIGSKISNPERVSTIAYGESKVENNPGYEYAIVISSFKNKNRAIAYLEKITDLKNEAIIEESDSNFRVLAGVYQNYKEAKKGILNLNKRGYKGWISVSKCRYSSESFHQYNRKTSFKVN
tara:strand:+ start:78 stop:2174 length:2097 start_codon:yes stop_codon:yes gene_type:complete